MIELRENDCTKGKHQHCNDLYYFGSERLLFTELVEYALSFRLRLQDIQKEIEDQ